MRKINLVGMMSISLILILSLISPSIAKPTVVKDIYEKTFTVDATSYSPYKPCTVKENYESGSCQYLYACYMIIPQGAVDISSAVQKECFDITDTKKKTFKVSFAPPRGHKWAIVTFLTVLKYEYDNINYRWNSEVEIPLDYRSAEELISLCEKGKILRNGVCYDYQPVCIDQYNTNICTNPYQLYVLDLGYGFDYDNPASYCADRDEDDICDETTSLTCPDTNGNGICDSDDVYIKDSSCIDENKNGICDDVETEGVFCRTYYQPVHCGEGESCITYPNKCFAEGAGCYDWKNGTCAPVYMNLCNSNSDCPPPCDGVVGICKNPDGKGNRCFYSGECNPRVIQCMVDEDCPEPPCVGITFTCSSDNRCVAVGQCITQPVQPSIWDKIAQFFSSLLSWIAGLFGW